MADVTLPTGETLEGRADMEMDAPWLEKLKEALGSWPTFVTVGSFALYLLGYFSVRFHLTTLGIGTDLTVLDERYLFAGAKFLVYLFSTLATVIFFSIPLLLIAGLVYYFAFVRRGTKAAAEPGRKPLVALVVGGLLAAVSIQMLMKQCFVFSNLLLADAMPWTLLDLKDLLLEDGETGRATYFCVVVLLIFITLALLFYAWGRLPQKPFYAFLRVLFAVLVGIQFLLLPVNYGVFIMDKEIPRVASLGGQPAAAGEEVWLVWEGNEGTTFLVRDQSKSPQRRLVTIPKKEVKNIEILGYDPIFRRLFQK